MKYPTHPSNKDYEMQPYKAQELVKPVNWNKLDDPIDLDVWSRMTANFWLPEKIALSNDKATWKTLTDQERLTVMRVFARLTRFDTLQAYIGASGIARFALTEHETQCMAFIGGMEAVHARSYSSIFSTLASTEEINEAFRWSEENEITTEQIRVLQSYYRAAHARAGYLEEGIRVRFASVLLESFLFYSGFYVSFKLASNAKLTNTADIIRLIMRDEGIHGYYIGYKMQQALSRLDTGLQAELMNEFEELASSLLKTEEQITSDIYQPIGWHEDALQYIRYNFNKARNNLGLEAAFNSVDVSPAILAQMTLDTSETHDFFSGSGSSYVLGTVEETEDDDWL